jgi:hypothetical protein
VTRGPCPLPVGATGLGAVGGVMDDAFAHQDHELTGVLVRQTVLPLRERVGARRRVPDGPCGSRGLGGQAGEITATKSASG